MKPEQSSMTVIVSVLPGHSENLKTLLRVIGGDIEGKNRNQTLRFADFPMIHFARWAVIPPPGPESENGPPYQLVFGTDHDGSDAALLQAIAANPNALLAFDAIYSHCEGWPLQAGEAQKVQYLLDRRIPYGARHIACRSRTVEDLKETVAARGRMEASLDNDLKPTRSGPGEKLDAETARLRLTDVRRHAEPLPSIPPPPLNWQFPIAIAGAVALIGGKLYLLFRCSPRCGLLGVASLAGLVAGLFATLHWHEARDTKSWEEATPPTLEHLRELRVWEDHKVQNQMTHLVPVKPGWFRRCTLRVVLAAVNFLARFLWNRGELGGIPTIHFARWMLIDGGRRLLFFSNFDGSWENYLGDFIDRAYKGLTGVWSNTIEFPPTHNLITDGAQRAEAFKNWTRKYQIETQVWYSAYPDVTVVNQLDALALCQNPAPGAEAELLKTL